MRCSVLFRDVLDCTQTSSESDSSAVNPNQNCVTGSALVLFQVQALSQGSKFEAEIREEKEEQKRQEEEKKQRQAAFKQLQSTFCS